MAKVDLKMPDEFLEQLSKLGSHTDEIAERVLEAGGEVVLAKIRTKIGRASCRERVSVRV